MELVKQNRPLITVVTVVYNDEKNIEYTIDSVITQKYSNYEYIIIDGGSTDNTIDLINKYRERLAYFTSEQDNGIYDAMNKAINNANGEWTIFMNCGDMFYNDTVLIDIANVVNEDSKADIIYGNTIYKYGNLFLKKLPLALELINREMVFCHQSAFIKTNLLKANLFELKYKLAADYNMVYNFYHQHKVFRYADIIVSIFDQQGGSTLRNISLSTKERYSIHKDYGSIHNWILCNKTIWSIKLRFYIKNLLPYKFKTFLFSYKHKRNLVFYEK